MKRLLCVFCLAFGAFALPLFSQDSEDSIFIINTITFNIKGRTNPGAILYTLEMKEGDEIKGRSTLEKYIHTKSQTLLNQRIFETANIEYTTGGRREDGKYPVDLVISTEDTINFIILPKPQFSSNSGFELTLKGRDYNFLGTMNPLRVDLGYIYDEKGQSSVLFGIDSDTPFKVFGYNWNFNFDISYNYRPNEEDPFLQHYFKNVTGLSMELPIRTTTLTLGMDETFILNDENSDQSREFYGVAQFQEGWYASSNPYAKWKIPLGLEVGDYGELTYTPKISATFNHEFPQFPLDEAHKGSSLSFSHTLGFDRVNWIGNYRQGFDVSMSNSFDYGFYRQEKGKDPLSINFSISGIGHFILADYFGISARLEYRYWFCHDPSYNDSAGDALRGILDKDVYADHMLSLNFDFPLRIVRFVPSEWFGKPKLRFMDFDVHFSPIVDLAFYNNPSESSKLPETSRLALGNNQNMLASGGFEIIVFPASFRSLLLRLSFAWNFIEQFNHPGDYYFYFPLLNSHEIFFGVDLHY